MISQEIYFEKIARRKFDEFFENGYATAGHNGPHGHLDTLARTTAHYLIIYSYLYKKYKDDKFLEISKKFVNSLAALQSESKSGAIQCMVTDKFDHLNGLIGQAWVIEALLYYFELTNDINSLKVAKSIFESQTYDWTIHLWNRVELDGRNIGIDPTCNHQVWFAACSYKLAEYCNDSSVTDRIVDFLTNGKASFLNIYNDGLLKHNLEIDDPTISVLNKKRLIKKILSPFKGINPRKLELRYIEYGYHIFDLYGLSILKERFGNLPLFQSLEYTKAIEYAKNTDRLDVYNRSFKNEKHINVYYYLYNSPAFEWAYVAKQNGFFDENVVEKLFDKQKELTYSAETDDFSYNNPDIDTWNARTYEIIRYLESK